MMVQATMVKMEKIVMEELLLVEEQGNMRRGTGVLQLVEEERDVEEIMIMIRIKRVSPFI